MCFLSPAQCDDFQLDELDFPSVFQLQSPIVIRRHCFVSKRFAILRKMMKFVGILFPIEIIIIKHIKTYYFLDTLFITFDKIILER